MGTKTAEIAVYPVSVFSTGNKSFWLESLERILESHPFLEHPHKQAFYTLLFIEKAIGTAMVDNHRIRLDEPKVICVKPNSVFSLDINRASKGYIVCFTEGFFSLRYNYNVLHQFSFLKKHAATFVRFTAKQTERWNLFFELMSDEILVNQNGVDHVLRSYLNILLYDLDRKFYKHTINSKLPGKDKKVIDFEKLLEEKYATHHTPSYYAGQLHISTNYLNKLCQEFRGISGGELIRKRITIEAQRLLHYTSLSVAEVAYQLGFESASYFVTFFKKNTGITPEYFRKNNH